MIWLLLPARMLGHLYRNHVRGLMPVTRPSLYAGVHSSFDYRVGDSILPRRFRPSAVEDIEDYEHQLIIALRQHVMPNSHVVVVGGGAGITATVAAGQVGDAGSVTCYEASRAQLSIIRECFDRNNVQDRVDLRFATVGEAIHLYDGGADAGPLLRPQDLPACDVLELDCEGAERAVLRDMTIRPGVVIVETHGQFGAPTDAVRARLQAIGYDVEDRDVAEPRFAQACRELDIRVLVARLKPGGADVPTAI